MKSSNSFNVYIKFAIQYPFIVTSLYRLNTSSSGIHRSMASWSGTGTVDSDVTDIID